MPAASRRRIVLNTAARSSFQLPMHSGPSDHSFRCRCAAFSKFVAVVRKNKARMTALQTVIPRSLTRDVCRLIQTEARC